MRPMPVMISSAMSRIFFVAADFCDARGVVFAGDCCAEGGSYHWLENKRRGVCAGRTLEKILQIVGAL